MGLAMMVELPLVVVDVQRGGPSTGLPTKTEQSDLLQVLFGRNGEAPIPVVAASSPADCFDAAIEACRIALTYRTPVVLLSDGYLANSAEPWRLPEVDELPDLTARSPSRPSPTARTASSCPTCATPRPWRGRGRPRHGGARAPGRRHREGARHRPHQLRRGQPPPQHRDPPRAPRAGRRSLPPLEVDDPSGAADVLVVGWGSTEGPDPRGVPRAAPAGPTSRGSTCGTSRRSRRTCPILLRSYRRVILPENNMGQLAMLLRAKTLVDVKPYNRVTGQPFSSAELVEAITDLGFDEVPPGPTGGAGVTTDEQAHQEGLHLRPRGALVPGLRGLRDPGHDPVAARRLGCPPGVDGVRVGYRVLVPVPLLHGHLRLPLDPRAGADAGDRARDHPARPRRLGRHRGRRRALDRRQPPDPRAAAQRQPQHPAVQQRDLRADQGPVLADLAARRGPQVDADGLARPAGQPGQPRARRRGDLRRPQHRHRPSAPDRGAHRGATSTAGPPSSRSTRTATSSTTARSRR
jgi:hypothetical protein